MHKGSCLCGAVEYEIDEPLGDIVRPRIGSLDTPVGKQVGMHIFVGSKANWDDIHDTVPQHAERH